MSERKILLQTAFTLLLLLNVSVLCQGFIFINSGENQRAITVMKTAKDPCDLTLNEIASKLKLQVFDLDEGVYGIDSSDVEYGIEIVKASVSRQPSLGLDLVEMMSGGDGRGLVLINSLIPGGNAESNGKFKPGDSLTWVGVEPKRMQRVEACDFDTVVQALRSYTDEASITLVAKRLVKRQTLDVSLIQPDGSRIAVKMLAGSNLRGEMLRQDFPVYDAKTKRFDQPYVTGNCGGEGICGTCLVEVVAGKELLNEPDRVESAALAKQPIRWRLSCRVIIGANNKPGKIEIKTIPQLQV